MGGLDNLGFEAEFQVRWTLISYFTDWAEFCNQS